MQPYLVAIFALITVFALVLIWSFQLALAMLMGQPDAIDGLIRKVKDLSKDAILEQLGVDDSSIVTYDFNKMILCDDNTIESYVTMGGQNYLCLLHYPKKLGVYKVVKMTQDWEVQNGD